MPLVVFMGLAFGVAALFALSVPKYRETIAPLEEKDFRLKKLIPAALLLLDLFKYRYTTGYDRKLIFAIAELRSARQAMYYLKIHWANKVVLALLALLFVTFVGAFTTVDAGYGVFSAILLAGAVWLPDRDLQEKVKKRRLSIQMDFPDFINKLTLLINAGMTVSRAWERVTLEGRKEAPLYGELSMAMQEIKAGKPEHKAYEEFAKRCRIPEVSRFVSVLLQNMRKGSSELVPMMRLFANDCWEMRRNAARRLGEEASTRLLLPMMLMFVAILLIVGTPAILSLRGI